MKTSAFMNRFNLTFVGIFAIGSLSSAKIPGQIRINCQSNEIGRIEVTLDQPHQYTMSDEYAHYRITTKRYDRLTNQYLGTETLPIDIHSNLAEAYIATNEVAPLFPEPTVYLKVPAFGVDWKKSGDQCYVQAPSFGFNLTLGMKTNTIYETHSQALITPYQTNPNITTTIVPGVGFGQAVDTLNGEYCPSTSLWTPANDTLQCSVEK